MEQLHALMLRCRQEYMGADYLPSQVRDDIASLMLALQESQVALQDSQERVNRAIDVADALRRAIAEAKQQMNEDW
jgi:hypothetical protein